MFSDENNISPQKTEERKLVIPSDPGKVRLETTAVTRWEKPGSRG